MRYVYLGAGLLLSACAPEPAVVQTPPPPLIVDCTIDAPVTPTTCTNLLAVGWDALPANQMQALADWVNALKPSQPTPGMDIVNHKRKASVVCRKGQNGNDDMFVDMEYVRPRAMENFPINGTKGRFLVTAVFSSIEDQNCMESRFGGVKTHADWRRIATFNAAKTKKTVPPSDDSRDDIVFGEWQSWAIEQQGSSSRYRMHELKRGAYVRCGFPHGWDKGNLSYITCRDAAVLHAMADSTAGPAVARSPMAMRSPAVEAEFSRLIARYNAGDQQLWNQLEDNPFEAPAWGRCGNLGCCASY